MKRIALVIAVLGLTACGGGGGGNNNGDNNDAPAPTANDEDAFMTSTLRIAENPSDDAEPEDVDQNMPTASNQAEPQSL
ncbi:MAG: hypothetical protein HY308_12100 [Gammaproteobacteria bacterium]|nr:hypothetical protein [Gammaproteobacteria bacterium]